MSNTSDKKLHYFRNTIQSNIIIYNTFYDLLLSFFTYSVAKFTIHELICFFVVCLRCRYIIISSPTFSTSIKISSQRALRQKNPCKPVLSFACTEHRRSVEGIRETCARANGYPRLLNLKTKTCPEQGRRN